MATVRLTPEIEKRLDDLARLTGRTKTYYVKELIEDNIDELENYYLAAASLERVRKGKEKTQDLASMRQQLGLED